MAIPSGNLAQLLNMAIEIVSLPIKKMVIFPSVTLVMAIEIVSFPIEHVDVP